VLDKVFTQPIVALPPPPIPPPVHRRRYVYCKVHTLTQSTRRKTPLGG